MTEIKANSKMIIDQLMVKTQGEPRAIARRKRSHFTNIQQFVS